MNEAARTKVNNFEFMFCHTLFRILNAENVLGFQVAVNHMTIIEESQGLQELLSVDFDSLLVKA